MAVQFDSVPRPQNDNSGLTVTTGVGNPGGGIGLRVIIDDTVITSEQDAELALLAVTNELRKRTWPVS